MRSGDADRHHHTARSRDLDRFGEGGRSIVAIGQVVERPEEQHRVVARADRSQITGVAERCRHPGETAFLCDLRGAFDVECDRVDDVYGVAAFTQRHRVHPSATTDVEQPGGRWRQHTVQQFQRSEVLQTRSTVDEQPRLLEAELVVRRDVRIDHESIIAELTHATTTSSAADVARQFRAGWASSASTRWRRN